MDTRVDWSRRPGADEFAAFYRGYVEAVPAGDILEILSRNLDETLATLRGLDEERAGFRYAPGKWSLREVLGHIVDSERVFAYRALRIARDDATPLPGFDQDDYVRAAGFERRPFPGLLGEFEHLRRANLHLFAGFGEEELGRRGTANEQPISVRALLFILAGHERHHLGVLRERYLAG